MFSPRLLSFALLSLGLVSAAPLDERQVESEAAILPRVETFLTARHDFLIARNSSSFNESDADPGFGPNHVLQPDFSKHLGPGPELLNRHNSEYGGDEGYNNYDDGHVFDPSIIHKLGPGPVIFERHDEDFNFQGYEGGEGYDDSQVGYDHVFDPSIIDRLGPGPVVLGDDFEPI
ncbi:hypothetical protein PENSPDRAFT_749032 [Peniophora sp. CONT]|nr:hypothetical protein PENSPDRAFT_749032 [Peniophora sp. CONT]